MTSPSPSLKKEGSEKELEKKKLQINQALF